MASGHFRIFISSPSDVFPERQRVDRVITRLNAEFGGTLLEVIRWERSYYTAAKTFQDQIPLPSETDLVICILWKRLGFELPPEYRRPDGTTPTGTEYEFEDAIRAARATGTPDVLVYRKAAPVLLDAEQVELERAQFEALKTFWTHWFRSETGHFTAAYQSFDTTDAFETAVEDHIRQWLARHKVALAGVTWPVEQRGSPFRGLQSFDAGHAEVFFGRQRTIERARERLADAARRGTPFLLILGASGSGKSSLARAGMLPRLLRPGAVPGVDLWRSCVLRPSEGETPIHALAQALYRADALPELAEGDSPVPADFAALLAATPDAAARAVRRALERCTAALAAREGFDRRVEARLLLLVDQFEEALAPPAARDGFACGVAALVGTGVVWAVVTLRSDLYAPFQACAPLMALRDGGAQLDLLPPSAAELGEIVTAPAAAAGLRFDARPTGARLDEALIAAADQPGVLPLLQLTLDALFEARDPAANLLTFAAYDALGGLAGVVERRAEATLAGLDAEAAASLPGVLRSLVNVTDDGVVTTRTAPDGPALGAPPARRLIEAFVAARLLLFDMRAGEAGLRVAHDALLSGWPRAAALIAGDREMLRTRDRVEAAARRWIAEHRDADYLLPPGRPLAEAVDLAAHEPDSLTADGAAFVSASRQAHADQVAEAAAHAQRELRLEAEAQQARADAATRIVRRTRAAVAVVSALLLVAAGTAVFANQQRGEANRQAAEARRQAVLAERSFGAALDGGTRLMDVVTAHLRDGGMTRAVARGLLDTAAGTLGALQRPEGDPAQSASFDDTSSRLQASLSTVQLAVCDSAGAQARAQDATAMAAAVFAQAPTPDRRVALVRRLGTLGAAAAANRDFAAARAAFDGTEALVASDPGPAGGPLDAARQAARRDDATLRLMRGDEAAALAMLRDDLAWQEQAARDRPQDTEPAASQAFDLRRIANVLLGRADWAGAGPVLEREATILRGLAAGQPANGEWQRALAINIRQHSRLAAARGDMAGALSQAQDAADLAGRIAQRDPGNADWQRDLLIASANLGGLLVRQGDAGAIRRVLAPALAGIRSLTGPEASSLQCRTDAARLHGMAGNSLFLSGAYDDAATELEASIALFAGAVAAEPDVLSDLAEAEASAARAYFAAGRLDPAIRHGRAGVDTARRLIGRDTADNGARRQLSAMRLELGDALRKAGDLDGAIAAYRADAADSAALAATQPGIGQWQHQVVASLLRVAAAELDAKRQDRQQAALTEAAAAAERLVALMPDEADWQRDLIDVRLASASAEMARGETAAALSHAADALALAEAAAAAHPADARLRLTRAYALTYLGIAYRIGGKPDEAQALLDRGQAAMQEIGAGKPATP